MFLICHFAEIIDDALCNYGIIIIQIQTAICQIRFVNVYIILLMKTEDQKQTTGKAKRP